MILQDKDTFPDVLSRFVSWYNSHHLSPSNSSFVTCGQWDLVTMLPEQCRYSGQDVVSLCRSKKSTLGQTVPSMLDVGSSGKTLSGSSLKFWNSFDNLRRVCQYQADISDDHWKVWEGKSDKCFFFSRKLVSGSHGHAKPSWTQVWGTPALWHWRLQESWIFFQPKSLKRTILSRNIWFVMKSLVDRGAELNKNGMTKKWLCPIIA